MKDNENLKVVIVEDQKFIAKCLADNINQKNQGYEVVGVFSNGKECLDKVKKLNFDIVISDIKMPVMDGLELSEKLLELKPDLQIILLSGYEDFAYAQKAVHIGISNYLLKPCSIDKIIEALDQARKILIEKNEVKTKLVDYEDLYVSRLPTYRQQAVLSMMFQCKNLVDEELKESLHLKSLFPSYLFCITYQDGNNSLDLSEVLKIVSRNDNLEIILNLIFDNKLMLIIKNLKESSYYESLIINSLKGKNLTHSVFFGGTLNKSEDLYYCYNSIQRAIEEPEIYHSSMENTETVDIIEKAKLYLESNYDKNISLYDLSEVLYISYSHLSHIFNREFGISFSAYLTDLRMKKALKFLKDANLKISDVAQLVGYHDSRYFNNCFKKYYSMTPTQYRRKYF